MTPSDPPCWPGAAANVVAEFVAYEALTGRMSVYSVAPGSPAPAAPGVPDKWRPAGQPDAVVPASAADPAPHAVTAARLRGVRPGMTEQEVSRLLGRPDSTVDQSNDDGATSLWKYEGDGGRQGTVAVLTFLEHALVQVREGNRDLRTDDPEMYRQGAEAGNPRAQYKLGLLCANSPGAARDDAAAVGWYRRAADQGHAGAQCNLGFMYEQGRGVAQDNAAAANWFRRAADQGDTTAQCNLGVLYEQGAGVTRDVSKAVECYRQAADRGSAVAKCNLGYLYEHGLGVGQDEAAAANWYRQAADQGLARAELLLGQMYLSGAGGLPRDRGQAREWIRRAAAQWWAPAEACLKEKFGEQAG